MRKVRTIEMKRLTVEEYQKAEKLPLIVVLDDVRSMYNIGSVFRALGAEESVDWKYFPTALEAVEELKKQGYTVFSVEQVEHSTKLQTFVPQKGQKYAVVMGNEVKGVHQEVVDASNGCLEIPQLGTKHSMNVSVTTGIIIYKFAEALMLMGTK